MGDTGVVERNRPTGVKLTFWLAAVLLGLTTVFGWFLAMIVDGLAHMGESDHARLWLLWLPALVSPAMVIIALWRTFRRNPYRASWLAGAYLVVIADIFALHFVE